MREENNQVPDGTVLEEFRKVGVGGGGGGVAPCAGCACVTCTHVHRVLPAPPGWGEAAACCPGAVLHPLLALPAPPAAPQGFMIGDKLLRPAMVKVSVSDVAAAAPAAADSGPDDSAASGSE